MEPLIGDVVQSRPLSLCHSTEPKLTDDVGCCIRYSSDAPTIANFAASSWYVVLNELVIPKWLQKPGISRINIKINLQMSALSFLISNFLMTVPLILTGARSLAPFVMTSSCPDQ